MEKMTYLSEEDIFESLIRTTAEVFHIEEDSIRGRTRKREVVFARHCFHHVFKDVFFDVSTTNIGRYTGRDHATVLHSIKTSRAQLMYYKNGKPVNARYQLCFDKVKSAAIELRDCRKKNHSEMLSDFRDDLISLIGEFRRLKTQIDVREESRELAEV
jgi:hypothetical protein